MKSKLSVLPVSIVAATVTLLVTVAPAFASAPIAAPEPVSVTLLGIGIAGLAGKKWIDSRRKK